MLQDTLMRPLHDLRISVTDRCNFRCGYCMPASETYRFLPRRELLSFEEITEVCRVFAGRGVRKLRITGGEPLLRKDLPELIAMLAAIKGIDDIAMTTNGFFLAAHAAMLARAGLNRVTVSMDSLDDEVLSRASGRKITAEMLLGAMDAAAAAGLKIKVNTVVQKGLNDHEIENLATCFRERGYTLRFIEYMDVGNLNGWNMTHVVTGREILARIGALFPCEPLQATYPGEVARRYRYVDGKSEFGLITSVSQPFCGGCHRARLSAEGQLYTCLFAQKGHDLKTLLRDQGPAAVAAALDQIWSARSDRYSELRGEPGFVGSKVEMFHIGG